MNAINNFGLISPAFKGKYAIECRTGQQAEAIKDSAEKVIAEMGSKKINARVSLLGTSVKIDTGPMQFSPQDEKLIIDTISLSSLHSEEKRSLAGQYREAANDPRTVLTLHNKKSAKQSYVNKRPKCS